jgi:archaellum component FlaC
VNVEDFAIARAQSLKPHHIRQRFAGVSLNGMTCAPLSDPTMVDSGRTAMPETVDTLARKIDRRFDAVDEHFAEQRAYIEFAYERLEQRMNAGFAEVKADLGGVKTDVAGVKVDLADVKAALGGVKTDVAGVKVDLADVKADLDGVKADLRGLTSRFDRLERKLDQLIDRHAP